MRGGVPVVVVEDDASHRDLIGRLLELVAPHSATTNYDAAGAELLEDEAPFGALVLLDRRLGTRDSLELVPALRRARPDLTVVLMSAFVTPEDRVACLGAGASGVFEKPGGLNGWRSTLLALLNGPQERRRAA